MKFEIIFGQFISTNDSVAFFITLAGRSFAALSEGICQFILIITANII
jgi:hypothetical protein